MRNKPTWVGSVSLLLVAILLGIGCQKDSAPVSPAAVASQTTRTSDMPSLEISPGLLDTLLGIDIRTILPAIGGTLNVRGCSFQVPAGALTLAKVLSFELLSSKPPKGLSDPCNRVFRFAPDFLTFTKTCILTVPFDELALGEKDPTKFACFYYNESRKTFEIQPTTVDLVNRRFYVKVKHFSQYAFGRVDE